MEREGTFYAWCGRTWTLVRELHAEAAVELVREDGVEVVIPDDVWAMLCATGCVTRLEPMAGVSKWFVMYRHVEDNLTATWRSMGATPTEPYASYEDAKTAAIKLACEMHYDVMVCGALFSLSQ